MRPTAEAWSLGRLAQAAPLSIDDREAGGLGSLAITNPLRPKRNNSHFEIRIWDLSSATSPISVTLDYVARACECERLAKGATDRQMRQRLEEFARQWWQLATVRTPRVELR
jgi:hypothetical protein